MTQLFTSFGVLTIFLGLWVMLFWPVLVLLYALSVRRSLARIAAALELRNALAQATQPAAPGAPLSQERPRPGRIALSQFGR